MSSRGRLDTTYPEMQQHRILRIAAYPAMQQHRNFPKCNTTGYYVVPNVPRTGNDSRGVTSHSHALVNPTGQEVGHSDRPGGRIRLTYTTFRTTLHNYV